MATLAVTTGLEKRRRITNRRSNFFIFLPGAFFRVFFGVKLGGAKIYSCLFHLGICFGELPVLVDSDAIKNSPTHPMVNHACLLGIPGNNDNPQASAASETPFFYEPINRGIRTMPHRISLRMSTRALRVPNSCHSQSHHRAETSPLCPLSYFVVIPH